MHADPHTQNIHHVISIPSITIYNRPIIFGAKSSGFQDKSTN